MHANAGKVGRRPAEASTGSAGSTVGGTLRAASPPQRPAADQVSRAPLLSPEAGVPGTPDAALSADAIPADRQGRPSEHVPSPLQHARPPQQERPIARPVEGGGRWRARRRSARSAGSIRRSMEGV